MDSNSLVQVVLGVVATFFSLFGLIVAIDPRKVSSFSMLDNKGQKKVTIQPSSFFIVRAIGLVFFVSGVLFIIGLLTGVFNAHEIRY